MMNSRTRARARTRLTSTAAALALAIVCYLIGTTIPAALPSTHPCNGQPTTACHWHTHPLTVTRPGGPRTFGHVHFHRHTGAHAHRHTYPLRLTPAPRPVHPATPRTRLASCYGPGLYGNSTANGTPFGYSSLGVATTDLPLHRYPNRRRPSMITLRANGRVVTVPVFDRGPYSGNRNLDVSSATARALGFTGRLDGCAAFGVRSIRTSR